MIENQRLALVTGGNRGLGFETCRQLAALGNKVLLTARSDKEGSAKAQLLQDEGLDVQFHHLDVKDSLSIAEVYDVVKNKYGRLDILVNNAGVLLSTEELNRENCELKELLTKEKQVLAETLEINVIGAYQLCELFLPMMMNQKYGRIVNVSSIMGQMETMGTEYPAYRISKTALNTVTKIFSLLASDKNVLVNSVCPGWVRTDMGGDGAPRTIHEGVKGIVWAAMLPDDGPNGGFFRDGESLSW